MIYIIFLLNIRNISVFVYVSVRYPIHIRIPNYPYLNLYPKNYNEYEYDKNIIRPYPIRLQPYFYMPPNVMPINQL
jgi:hypothetical protein